MSDAIPLAPKLDYGFYIDAVEREIHALREAADSVDLDAPVPSCPEWRLRDLLIHAGDFASFYSHRVCESTGADLPPWPNSWNSADRDAGSDERPREFFSDRATHLSSLLRSTPARAEVKTWAPKDQTTHFVARRSAHELSVHRFDAELAANSQQPIDASLAADGIDEIFVILATRTKAASGGVKTGGGRDDTLHLHSVDVEGEWTVVLAEDGVRLTREHSDVADLTIAAGASDLELVLYRRPPVGSVVENGDLSVLDRWYRAFTFD